MDIKIRSQAGSMLVDCTNKDIKLGGKLNELNQVIAMDFGGTTPLGKYKDMERATEIIDSIQKAIDEGFKLQKIGITIIMPQE